MTDDSNQSQTRLFLFPQDEKLTEMLSWMGSDRYPGTLAAVLARGFQRQQPGTRLAGIKCLKEPELVTSFFTGTLNKRVRAIFLVEAVLFDPQGSSWALEVKVTCTGRVLSRPEDGIVASDVKVQKIEQLVPGGETLLEGLSTGVTCERSGRTINWNAPLDEILSQTLPKVEQDEGSYYLSWPNEAFLGGLEGQLFTSFAEKQAGLSYISFSPVKAAYDGRSDDALLPEWEHLIGLFGPPDEQNSDCGFRWERGPVEILLLYQECSEPQRGAEYQKWITIRWLGNQNKFTKAI